jgi:Flp pilus assembly protein TadG
LPLLLLMFAAIVDFGLMLQRFLVVTNAAREGARIASLPDYTPADCQARATQYVREGLGDNTLTPTVTCNPTTVDPDAGGPVDAFPAQVVTVSLGYTFPILEPVVALFTAGTFDSITLRASSTMRVE